LLGRAPLAEASTETPRNSTTAIPPRIASVAAAFRAWGRWKALVPFAIASTPVSALQPDANARSATAVDAVVAVPTAAGSGTVAFGQSPSPHFPRPRAIIAPIATTNPYVGRANSRPASRTPRALATARTTRNARESSTRAPLSAGAAEVMARTPAAIETATVST
jgi:hypothetical protein